MDCWIQVWIQVRSPLSALLFTIYADEIYAQTPTALVVLHMLITHALSSNISKSTHRQKQRDCQDIITKVVNTWCDERIDFLIQIKNQNNRNSNILTLKIKDLIETKEEKTIIKGLCVYPPAPSPIKGIFLLQTM